MVARHLLAGKGSDIGIDGHAVARCIDGAAPRIEFATGDDIDPGGGEAVVPGAGRAAEQVEGFHPLSAPVA